MKLLVSLLLLVSSIANAETPAPAKILHLQIEEIPIEHRTLFTQLTKDLTAKTCWTLDDQGHAQGGAYRAGCVAFVEFQQRRWERIPKSRKYRISMPKGELRLEFFEADGKKSRRVAATSFPQTDVNPAALRETIVGWTFK